MAELIRGVIFALIFIVIFLLIEALIEAKLLCPVNHNLQLPHDDIKNAHNYRFLESSLTIFANMKVPCTGQLKSWQFYAQNAMIYGVYLGVFRQRKNDSSSNYIFDLVGATHVYEDISNKNVTSSNNAMWHLYPANPPIDVKYGDYIGVFYEKFKIRSEMLTISTISDMDMTAAEKRGERSYVLLRDSYDIERSNGVVDTRLAFRDYRKPALYAFFTSIITKNSTTTQSPQLGLEDLRRYTTSRNSKMNLPNPCFNTPTVSTNCWAREERAYFDVYQNICEAFVGCPPSRSDDTEAPNNFDSLNDCIMTCRPERQVAKVKEDFVPRPLVPFHTVPPGRDIGSNNKPSVVVL